MMAQQRGDIAVKHRILSLLKAGCLALAMAVCMTGIASTEALAQVKSLESKTKPSDTNPAPEIYDVQENTRHPRAYRQQPPLIPHRIEKYEIDLKVNQCMRCHDWPYNTQEKAPKISETHYVDREGKRLDKVAGTRWFCTQCHAPQANAKPLVENNFKPAQLAQ
jgi:cytochrome c-type protein NapB